MFSHFTTPSVSLAIGPSTIPDPTPIVNLFLFLCIIFLFFIIGLPLLTLLRFTRKTCVIIFSSHVVIVIGFSTSLLAILKHWIRMSLRRSCRVLSTTDLCSGISSVLRLPLLFYFHLVSTAQASECGWILRMYAWLRETVGRVFDDATQNAISALEAKLRCLEAEARAARSEAAEATETLQDLVPGMDMMAKMFEDYRTTIEKKREANAALQRRLDELQAALDEGEDRSFG